MAQGLTARIVGLAGSDPLFARIRQEAEESMRREPELATFLMTTILNHDTLESAVAYRVAARLDNADVSGGARSARPSPRRSPATPRSARPSAPTSWPSPTAIRPACG